MPSAAGPQLQKDGLGLIALGFAQLEPEQRSDGLDVLTSIGAILVPRLFGHPPWVQLEVRPVDRSKTTDCILKSLQRSPLDLNDRNGGVRGFVRVAEAPFAVEEAGGP
jgi:hypothetical protein